MATPLNTAYLKIARATEHLEELRRLHDEVCNAQAKDTTIEAEPAGTIDPGEAKRVVTIHTGEAVIPDRCRILVGDVANGLRSALDYLIGRLAELDSGPGERRTQFPIESTSEGFKSRRRSFLEGVSDTHISAIERLQPYNGCDWMLSLQKLSNFDKHSDLVIVVHDYLVWLTGTIEPADERGSQKHTVHLRLRPVLRIALGNGLPLIETLEMLKLKVTETVDTFKPELGDA
jgi:hypothetical protein